MNEIDAINKELKRLHKTMALLIEYPDRIIGDLMHSDVHADILDYKRVLIEIAKKKNGLEY